MPYYSRYRRRSGYSRYRRRYPVARRRYRRRSTTSGSVSSRSRIRVRVQAEQLVTLTIPANSTESNVCTSVPFAAVASIVVSGALKCPAVTSPLYQAYTSLFDQVKCDGVISKVAVTTPVGSSNSAVPALQIVTSYDRNGSLPEAAQLKINAAGSYVASPVTYSEVLESSGSIVRTALNNSVAKLTRSCWASDIQERTTFHDCTLNPSNNDSAYASNTPANVNFFCPLFHVAFSLPTTAPAAAQNISFVLSQTYYFTFRNPKFGAASGTSAAAFAKRTLDTEDEVIDEPSQALVDMAVRAADATGSLVRPHGRSGLTPQAKKTRLLDEADRYERESEEWHNRYEAHDAQVAERVGAKDWTRYPKSDRDLLQKFYNESSNKALAAERLRDEARDLDREEALSHTDTLPLDQ